MAGAISVGSNSWWMERAYKACESEPNFEVQLFHFIDPVLEDNEV